jgi:hypothetical protein
LTRHGEREFDSLVAFASIAGSHSRCASVRPASATTRVSFYPNFASSASTSTSTRRPTRFRCRYWRWRGDGKERRRRRGTRS